MCRVEVTHAAGWDPQAAHDCSTDRQNTGSQNHSGWWVPLGIISSNPSAHPGSSRAGAQDCVQTAFDYLQEWRLHNLSGQLVPVLRHPHSEKSFFLMFRQNLLCFRLCPSPLVLSLGTTEKSLALFAPLPPIGYLYTWIRPPEPSLLQAEPGSLSLSLHDRPCHLQCSEAR